MKLQATGYAPIEIAPIASYSRTESGEKRGVTVELVQTKHEWWGVVTYNTEWGIERPFTWVFCGPLDLVCATIRDLSKNVLPPGAGFPATPSFETRQSKLRGMMETLTLTALSGVLSEAHQEKS